MTENYSIRHADQRAITSADQAELKAIASGIAVPDAGIIDERLSGELEDLETADTAMEPWQEQDVQLEDEVGAIRDEIVRRKELMGASYPFEIAGGKITYTPSLTGFYEYCLAICQTSSDIRADPYTRLPRSFERIVGLVVGKHLGPNWRVLHTGWPRDAGQPTRFDGLIQTISEITSDKREWVWNPDQGYPTEAPQAGDGGIDFVIWKPALDSRVGQLFVLGQCACGNDWDTKFDDLTVAKLEPWMGPFTLVPVVRSFATPFLLSDGNLDVAHRQAGWALDRARLTLMAAECAADPDFVAQIPQLRELFELASAAA